MVYFVHGGTTELPGLSHDGCNMQNMALITLDQHHTAFFLRSWQFLYQLKCGRVQGRNHVENQLK